MKEESKSERFIRELRGPGWTAECRACVASKFVCDEHYKETKVFIFPLKMDYDHG